MSDLSIADMLGLSADALPYTKEKTIYRTQHSRENPYTLITNKLLRDTSIRHSDRGLMAQLLSWSDFHHLCIKALVKRSVEGRDAIRGMLDRLILAGYIRTQQTKSSDGRFDRVVYQIYEESTGVVVADLDMDGIVENEDDFNHAQLDLFTCEIVIMDTKTESVNQPADGKAVNGEPEPNNNYVLRNTIFNNNPQDSLPSEIQDEVIETKESLLNKWKLDLNDSQVKARLGMAGLLGFIADQETLNRFLIDFNQQHGKYKLTDSQRLKNFAAYLVRVKHTPVEYKKHFARLRALGLDLPMPQTGRKQSNARTEQIQSKQNGVNPFESTQETLSEAPQFSILMDGF